MSQGFTRSIFRWIHLVFSIPILGYIYSPFDKIPNYAPATRFVFVPVMILSGLWMWKGHVVRRRIWRRWEKKKKYPKPNTSKKKNVKNYSDGWPIQARFWLEWGSS